jgi:hypothetical protein
MATPERTPKDWRSMLSAIPVPNRAATITRDAAGNVRITVRGQAARGIGRPLAWLFNIKRDRTLELDRLATRIWELCDGTRSVEQVIATFADDCHLTFHEARAAITGYLKLLVRRAALVIAMPKENARPGQARTPGSGTKGGQA